jgi:tetratricopeptide (TPR) repeat protein
VSQKIPSAPPLSAAFFARGRTWIIALLAAGALAAVYLPALRGGFVWDDAAHVTAPALRSGEGLGRIWTEVGATQQYYPLLHTAFWLEHRLWGGSPLGYHLANLALHALAATLFGLALRRLAVPGAILAALIFAFHPVHVESVAWISEQKNTLSTVFYLAAALAYLRFRERFSAGSYCVASAFFVCALLTKTVTATLPAALLVVLWWRQGRLGWRDAAPLLPWLVLGVAAGLFTAWVERAHIGAEGAAFDLPFVARCLLAARVVWFYLGKLCWPANLTFIYPRWTVDAADPAAWWPLIALLIVLAWLWRVSRTNTRSPLAMSLLFGGSLFPVLGFFNIYPFLYSYVADHFQYLASLAVIASVAAALVHLGATARPSRIALVGLILAALAGLTRQQSGMFRDVQTLFRATIARNPDCWMAYNNLGKELLASPATQREAIACFERAIALRPDYFEAHNNLGLVLTQTGRSHDAIPHLEKALKLKPRAYEAHNNLAIALAGSGRAEEALRSFAAAAALNPRLPNIHENWGKALLLLNRRDEAAERFAIAQRLRGAPTPNPRTSPPTPR